MRSMLRCRVFFLYRIFFRAACCGIVVVFFIILISIFFFKTDRPTDEDNPASQLVFHNPSSIRGLMTGIGLNPKP